MKKSVALSLAALLLVLFLGGCRTDAYYQDRAVQRARTFLLKNAPELTPEQSYYVKFNRPVLLAGEIFGQRSSGQGFGPELKQICVSWTIPGLEEDYLVYGVSQGRMDYWFPERLIRKKFEQFSLPVENAMRLSRTYAQSYLYDELSRHEFNYLRFGFPYVIRTSFELTVDFDGTLSEEEIEKSRAALEKGTQISLVWKFPDGGDSMLFCGVGRPDLNGWRINFAGRISEEELAERTVEILKTPENAQTPIELPEKEEAVPAPVVPGFGTEQAAETVAPGESSSPEPRESADNLPAPPEGNMVDPITEPENQ